MMKFGYAFFEMNQKLLIRFPNEKIKKELAFVIVPCFVVDTTGILSLSHMEKRMKGYRANA